LEVNYSPRHRRLSPLSGFTLIELLVVIAIIAILAAILFPVFAQAREKARSISCLSNEKQLGVAAMQYSQDNDEFMPEVWTPGNVVWWQQLNPYVKNQQVYLCPDDTYDRGSNGTPVSYAIAFIWGDWGDCPAAGCSNQGKFSAAGNNLSTIKSPSSTIAFMERFNNYKNWNQTWAADMFCDDGEFLYGQGGSATSPKLRAATAHAGGSNYVFCDGHAKWLRFEQTMQQQPGQPSYAQMNTQWNSTYTEGWRQNVPPCPSSLNSGAVQATSLGMWTAIQ